MHLLVKKLVIFNILFFSFIFFYVKYLKRKSEDGRKRERENLLFVLEKKKIKLNIYAESSEITIGFKKNLCRLIYISMSSGLESLCTN